MDSRTLYFVCIYCNNFDLLTRQLFRFYFPNWVMELLGKSRGWELDRNSLRSRLDFGTQPIHKEQEMSWTVLVARGRPALHKKGAQPVGCAPIFLRMVSRRLLVAEGSVRAKDSRMHGRHVRLGCNGRTRRTLKLEYPGPDLIGVGFEKENRRAVHDIKIKAHKGAATGGCCG
jgi:hypothetical protein